MKNKALLLVILLLTLSITACGRETTEITSGSGETAISGVDNSEYEQVDSIFIYTKVDTKEMYVDHYPRTYAASYLLTLDDKNKTCSFNYQSEEYPKYGRMMYDVVRDTDFSEEVFYEIKEMIYDTQIQQFEFTFDENKMRVDTIEPYCIYLSYETDGRFHILPIKTPENIEQIMDRLNEMVSVSKVEHMG